MAAETNATLRFLVDSYNVLGDPVDRSFFKIDASYLSPNVNMASRLQAATKQYGVFILVSHLLYHVFTPEVQQICREIDRITVKGSNQPIRIYTVDMELNDL